MNCRIGFVLFVLLGTAVCWPDDIGQQQLADPHVKAGNRLFDDGKYPEAAEEYKAGMKLAPSWYEPHYELAATYEQLKQADDAQKEFEKAIELKSDCWLCYQGLGNLADENGKPENALEYYKKAIVLAPNEGRPRYNTAITFLHLKKQDEAIATLKDAEHVQPGYASPFFLLGKIYFRQQKLYPAFEQLFQATRLEKSGPRFDEAKKLTDVQIVLDEKLAKDASPGHMSYCLVRAGALSEEEYHKRFPNADTYVENLQEEEGVLSKLSTIISELEASRKKPDPEFGRLVAINKAGYLAPFILASSGNRFADDLKKFEAKYPGRLAEFNDWAKANKISLEPLRPRCEVRWMGQVW
jgi:tetratricopeptide (TPR) repeat protein